VKKKAIRFPRHYLGSVRRGARAVEIVYRANVNRQGMGPERFCYRCGRPGPRLQRKWDDAPDARPRFCSSCAGMFRARDAEKRQLSLFARSVDAELERRS
jgi:hypothetical protein